MWDFLGISGFIFEADRCKVLNMNHLEIVPFVSLAILNHIGRFFDVFVKY